MDQVLALRNQKWCYFDGSSPGSVDWKFNGFIQGQVLAQEESLEGVRDYM